MSRLLLGLVATSQLITVLSAFATAAEELPAGGSTGKTLSFPADRSIGTVYVREPVNGRFGEWNEFDNWERLGDARGEVRIPKGHEVRLDIGTVVANDLSPLDALRPNDLTTLWLNRSDVTDDELRHVGRLSGLIDLGLASTRITDAGIIHLSGLTSLRVLKCGGRRRSRDENGRVEFELSDVSGESAETLSDLSNLERIDVSYSSFSDAGLRSLARLPKLRSLELGGTQITDAGIKALRGKTTLQQLSLGLFRNEGARITDAAIDDLCTLTGLHFLRLNATRVTDDGVKSLGSLTELRSLAFDDTEVTIDGLVPLAGHSQLEYLRVPFPCGDAEAKIFAKFPALKRIIGRFDQITDDGLEALAAAPALEFLDLSSRNVTARGVNTVGNMTQLKYLWLYEAPVDDQALRPLGNLKNLELATLDLPRINGPGLQHLARIQSLKELRVRFNRDRNRDANDPPQPPVDLSVLTALQSLESLTLEGDRLEPSSFDGALQLVRLKYLTVDARLAARHIADLSNAVELSGLALGVPSEITDDGLLQLSRLRKLESLDCRGVFTNSGFEHLAKLKHLTFLQFASPFVSDSAVEDLKRRLPGLTDFDRYIIGKDEHTLTLIRNRSLWPDEETVARELDNVQLSLNGNDNLFRNGARAQRSRYGADALEGQPAPPIVAARWLHVPNEDFDPPSPLGHLTIVHFWVNWHDSYLDEMAQLKKVQQRFSRFGVRILSIHSSHWPHKVEDALKRTQISWPCAIDKEEQTRNAWPGNPYSLIGPDGNIIAAGLHPIDLERAVQRYVLKQRR